MKRSLGVPRGCRDSDPVKSLFLSIAFFIASGVAQPVMAQVSLGESGETKIEAEAFSARSEGWPYVESCEDCSGGARIVFFQEEKWFELDVNVPRLTRYSISLRAAAKYGANVEVEMINNAGAAYLATIHLPATGGWSTYHETRPETIALPAGVRTLRFTNPGSGANVDYITVNADTTTQTRELGPNTNPLKGFGSSWDRKNEPHASVGFQYIEWGKFEKNDDEFDWGYVESTLARSGTKGRHVILQFVVDWDNHSDLEPAADSYRGPDWLPGEVINGLQGLAVVDPDNAPDRIGRATDYDHPIFVAEAMEAIDTLFNGDGTHPGLRNDPRTFILQVGVLGYFGEWHTYPVAEWEPEQETKRDIFDTYLRNLGDDGLTQVRYPDQDRDIVVPQLGLGYTNGSATPTGHGYEFGISTYLEQLWMNGPIGGEWPPAIEDQYWYRFFASGEGEFFLRLGGYSTMTPPEVSEIQARIPGWEANPEGYFMHMHRLMGYNFRSIATRQVVASGQTQIEVDLQNVGIAPFYKNWDVQLAVLDAESGDVVSLVDTDTDIRALAPNASTTIAGNSNQQLDPEGEYKIGLRILQPGAAETKANGWKLKARNTYVELFDVVEVIPGVWDENNALEGGWNIVADVKLGN